MSNNTWSGVFFFISSIGFVTLWALVAVFLFYLIRSMNTFSRILTKVEKNIESIGDTTKEMIKDVQDSIVFRFLFGRKKHRRHTKDPKGK